MTFDPNTHEKMNVSANKIQARENKNQQFHTIFLY